MKLNEARDNFRGFSEKASDIARHLAFAGIGIVWLFRSGNGSSISINEELLIILCSFILVLTFDLLQYVFGTLIWYFFNRHHEKKGTNENTFIDIDVRYIWIIDTFFILKLITVGFAYLRLIFYFFSLTP